MQRYLERDAGSHVFAQRYTIHRRDAKISPWDDEQEEAEHQSAQKVGKGSVTKATKFIQPRELRIYCKKQQNGKGPLIQRKSSLPKIHDLQLNTQPLPQDPNLSNTLKYKTLDQTTNRNINNSNIKGSRIRSPKHSFQMDNSIENIVRRRKISDTGLPALTQLPLKMVLKGQQCHSRASSTINSQSRRLSQLEPEVALDRYMAYQKEREIAPIKLESVEQGVEKQRASLWLRRRKQDIMLKVYQQIRSSHWF